MPRARTVSLGQLERLLKKMEANTEMANGHPTSLVPTDHRRSRRFWAVLAEELNRLPSGTVKRGNQWKSYWHDLKYRARKRVAELRLVAACGAPPGPGGARALSDIERRVLSVAGMVDHRGDPIPVEELVGPRGRGLAWPCKTSPPPSPLPASPGDAGSAPPASPALDPLSDEWPEEEEPSAGDTSRPRRAQPPPPAAEPGGEQCECAQSTLSRTQDRIALTQERIARSQERIALTQERIAQNQERTARAHERLAAALEAARAHDERVPALLEELLLVSRKMLDNEY